MLHILLNVYGLVNTRMTGGPSLLAGIQHGWVDCNLEEEIHSDAPFLFRRRIIAEAWWLVGPTERSVNNLLPAKVECVQ